MIQDIDREIDQMRSDGMDISELRVFSQEAHDAVTQSPKWSTEEHAYRGILVKFAHKNHLTVPPHFMLFHKD